VLHLTAEVTTSPVGYVNIGLLRDSDTIVAVPLAPGIKFTGSFSAITPGANGRFTAHVASPVGFIPDQFKKIYYVRIRTGSRRGTYFTIVGNSANELTLDSAGHDFSAIAPGRLFLHSPLLDARHPLPSRCQRHRGQSAPVVSRPTRSAETVSSHHSR
jgi:uncharacterized protein (TIGR02597 family)